MSLPPGQHLSDTMPRFGMPAFANRFPTEFSGDISVQFTETSFQFVQEQNTQLEMTEQTSDFHCVTTWSCTNLKWKGYRFVDFYEKLCKEESEKMNARFVLFKGQDGYYNSMWLEDALAKDVMLATHLNGKRLNIAHGAPIRLVAPAHYGYKSVKHLAQIIFLRNNVTFGKFPENRMTHERGRVAQEERSRGIPAKLCRLLYRPTIKKAAKEHAKALQLHLRSKG